MIKRYCDICGNEMRKGDPDIELDGVWEYLPIDELIIDGHAKIHKVVFNDICRDCKDAIDHAVMEVVRGRLVNEIQEQESNS